MAEGNGVYKHQLDIIQTDVKEIKDDISRSLNNLSHAVDKFSLTVEALTVKLSIMDKLVEAVQAIASKFDSWIRVAENVVPIRFVLWILAGVLILVVLLFAGVEGIRALLKIPTL